MNKLVGKYLVRDANEKDLETMLAIYRKSELYADMTEEMLEQGVDFDEVAAEELGIGKRYLVIDTESNCVSAYVENGAEEWVKNKLRIVSVEELQVLDVMMIMANVMQEQGVKATRDWLIMYDI